MECFNGVDWNRKLGKMKGKGMGKGINWKIFDTM